MASGLTRKQEVEVLRLLSQHKDVTPQHVLEVSRDPNSPLHSFVGWDRSDDELAARYRLERARVALELVRIRETEEERRKIAQVKATKERQRLTELLREMADTGARRTISYPDRRGYRDVMVEYIEGREANIVSALLTELEQWINSRALLNPPLRDRLREFLDDLRRELAKDDAA